MPEILVVDDSRVIREMVIASLRAEPGLQFTQASSGLEAIEQLSMRTFALLVLDLNMPDITGYEVIQFIRGQDKLKTLPVVVLTTRGDETSRTKALELGASVFMTKPFTPDELAAAVRTWLAGPPPSP